MSVSRAVNRMRLNTSFLSFVVLVIAAAALVIATFIVQLGQAIAVAPLIIGTWLIILGVRKKQTNVVGVVSTPAVYTFWGGTIASLALMYLSSTTSSDVRVTLLVLIVSIGLTVSLSYYIEKRNRGWQTRPLALSASAPKIAFWEGQTVVSNKREPLCQNGHRTDAERRFKNECYRIGAEAA